MRYIKYMNRRYYCTEQSQYVCLGDIENAIRRGDPVEIIRKVDGKDLTREVLLDIWRMREGAQPTLSTHQLLEMVKR